MDFLSSDPAQLPFPPQPLSAGTPVGHRAALLPSELLGFKLPRLDGIESGFFQDWPSRPHAPASAGDSALRCRECASGQLKMCVGACLLGTMLTSSGRGFAILTWVS
jgi:hypothetical protein